MTVANNEIPGRSQPEDDSTASTQTNQPSTDADAPLALECEAERCRTRGAARGVESVGRSKKSDLTGQRFARLLVIGPDEGKQGRWICTCDCGKTVVVRGGSLRSGNTRSCGCLHKERVRSARTTHGQSKTKEYRAWCNAKQRCFNPNHPQYARYGGRGITMCKRWKDSFEAFLLYMSRAGQGRSLDRINGFGDYTPENCRWATRAQQLEKATNVQGSARLVLQQQHYDSGGYQCVPTD